MYAKYASVAEGYAMLAVNGDQESLKRLVFLWWYSAVEPPYLSGLRDFPPELSQRTASLLEESVKQGVDDEFRRMLTWYYSITEWHFEECVPEIAPTLRNLLGMNRLRSGSTDLGLVDLRTDRGAMGRYFGSMRTAQLRRK